MSLEYTFKSSCYPIGDRRICEVSSSDELFTSPAYSKILGILSSEGVFTDDILSLWYKLSKWDKWKKVENAPLDSTVSNSGNNRIFIKVQLKPCTGQLQERIYKRIDELKEENLNLRQQLESLSANVRHLQRQMDEFKQTPRADLTPTNNQANSSTTALTDSFQRDTDVAYLYAIPLVRKGTNCRRNEPIRDPIDIHKELSSLERVFAGSHKELQVAVSSGNVANLRHVLGQRPKVLHISCHGGYECEQGEARPCLYLEDAKQPGMMEKFNEETIKEIFSVDKNSEEEIRPRVVFISACHSQRFGEIIKEAGIPNVIAVNGYTQIADEAAIGFAASFYYFLLMKKTVKEAFESAKKEERYSNMSINLCCCAHRHEKDCLWNAKKDENFYEAHAMHVPSCDCKFGGNLHKSGCRWLKEIPSEMFEITLKNSSNLKRVCCCCSQIPHEEEEKFILMSQNAEVANEKLFDEVQAGEVMVMKNFVEELVPKPHEVMIGRNVEMQQLVEMLSCDPNKKIVCVIGPSRVGKKLLIKTAIKYIMECVDTARYDYENFPDGFVSIKLTSTLWLLSKLNGALLPPPNVEARSLEELPKKILSQRKVVILECEHVMQSNAIELIGKLRAILEEGVKIRFVLIAQKRIPELDIDGELILKEDLDTISAYSIIKAKLPEWKTSYIKFTKTKLAQEMRTPWLIKKAAILLKDYTEDEVYERLRSEETPMRSEKHKTSFENALRAIEEKCETLLGVHLLAQMQTGVFECVFEELVGESKGKLDGYVEAESLAVVTKSCVEELGEVRYKLYDDIGSYINEVKLSGAERAGYQLLCLKALAHISRSLVRSCNFLRYRCMTYSEFSAIIGDGIWAPLKHPYKMSLTVKDPIARFQYEKDNVIALLDPNVLADIAREIPAAQLPELLDNIKELAICSFTLLQCFRPAEAMDIVDAVQGFVSRRNAALLNRESSLGRRYAELEATMAVVRGSIALNHAGQLEIAEAMGDAEKAENLFSSAKNHAGVGEAQFLQGLLLEQRNRKYDEIESAYNSALLTFSRAKCSLGEARVALAKAILALDSMRTEGALELLTRAINILKEHEYFNNMLGVCRYRRGRYYLNTRNYELAKEDLENALEDFGSWNNWAVDKCNVSLQELSELQENNCPTFCFLKAVPLVMKDEDSYIPLAPNIRNCAMIKDVMNICFSQINKSAKIYINTLSLENLKYAFTHNCTLLHISSNYYEDGYLSMEDNLGHLNKVALEDLHAELKEMAGLEKCRVVVVSIPKAEDVAQMFVDLKVPHVIYFSFSTDSLYAHSSQIEDFIPKPELMYRFSIDFYKKLTTGFAVSEAWRDAKRTVAEYVEAKCEAMKIKGFQYEKDVNPILLPHGDHNVPVFTNLQSGGIIDISPKRAQCDIEQDRRPFVGRQVEAYTITKALCERQCVNLYGKCGVGKSRLAKEIGFFIFLRMLFRSYICHFDIKKKGKTLKAELETKLQYSQSNASGLPVLVIIDNMTRELWQKERNYFRTLRNDRNCVFLFVSQKFLEPDDNQSFPMLNYGLLPFTNVEVGLDMLFALINNMKGYSISNLLRIETDSYCSVKISMMNLKAFKQTNGYPKLISILVKKIVGENCVCSEVEAIDLWKDKTIDPKYRKVMKRISKERVSEVVSCPKIAPRADASASRCSFNLLRKNKLACPKKTQSTFQPTSKSFVFMGGLNGSGDVREEGAGRTSCGSKGLLKLEKPRDISPIEDCSQESSKSDSEDSVERGEVSSAFSMILASCLREKEGKAALNSAGDRQGISKCSGEKVARQRSPRNRRKGRRLQEEKAKRKTLGKDKGPIRRASGKLKDCEKALVQGCNLEAKLNPVESEADSDSS